jgi:hypothetical protein
MFTRLRFVFALATLALAACSSAPPPPPPTQVVITATSISCAVGSPCTETITGSGGLQANYQWSTTGVTPSFLQFTPQAANYVFNGTATTQDYEQAGQTHSYSITVNLTDQNTTATATFTVTLLPPNGETPPTIAGSPATTDYVGVAYNFVPAAQSPNPPLTFSATGLPAWLNIDPNTGELSGTPSAAETDGPITITVTDVFGSTASLAAFTITVTQPAAPVLSGPGPGSNSGASPNAPVGQAYIFAPQLNDPLNRVWTYSVSNLPIWADFNASTGTVTGTPIYAFLNQSYSNISVSATSGSVNVGPISFSVTVTAPLAGYAMNAGSPIGNPSNQVALPSVWIGPTALNGQYSGGYNAFVSMSAPDNQSVSEQLLLSAQVANPQPVQLSCGGAGVSCGTLTFTGTGSSLQPTVANFTGSNPCTVNSSPTPLTNPGLLQPIPPYLVGKLFTCTINDDNGAPAYTWETTAYTYPYNQSAVDLTIVSIEYTAPLHQAVQTMMTDYAVSGGGTGQPGSASLIGLTQINANGANAGVPTFFHP